MNTSLISSYLNANNAAIFGAAALALFIVKIWSNGTYNNKKRDLSNQLIVITGSNTGIGLETAKNCVQNGAKVILACRDQKRTQNALDLINSIKPNSAEFMRLDLSDLQSVRLFVNEFKSKYNKLDTLINNAGIMHIPDRVLTKDGFESQIGTNHFGHFLLTHLLMDSLKASPQFRIINLSSLAHSFGSINFDDLHYEKRSYDRNSAYSQSKIANILFTIGLQKRITQQKLNGIAVSLHPGVVRTELTRHYTGILGLIKFLISPLWYIFSKSPEQGAQTSLYCVHESFDRLVKGGYYSDCKIKKYGNKQITEENADKFWDISLKQLKL
ncbi:hypothetical protein ABPG72_001406 [Tetrahymena utriculariae]